MKKNIKIKIFNNFYFNKNKIKIRTLLRKNLVSPLRLKIRQISKEDLKNVKKFQDFINSLVEEEVQISMNKKLTLKEEKKWLKETLKNIENHNTVFLIAEDNDIVVGTTGITLQTERQSHIGGFGIFIRKGYRGIGLGSYLTDKIIKLAKKELKPRLKIIRLSVFSTNKPAIGLYKKYGFKIVAKIPKQREFKGKLVDEIIMLKEI